MRSVLKALMFFLSIGCCAGSATAQGNEGKWQGFYLGVHGAHLSAKTDYDNPNTPGQKFSGQMLGVQAGYNWQMGRVVMGIEGDVSFGKIEDFIRDGNFLTEDGELRSMGTLRGRLGYSFGNFMPFITAGWMWARLEQGITCPAGAPRGIATVCAVTGAFDSRSTETFNGFVFGAGAEYAINRSWSLKGEVLFANLGDETYTGTVPVFGTQKASVELDLGYVARLGVNYRF